MTGKGALLKDSDVVYYACVMKYNLLAPNPEPQSVRMFMSLSLHPLPFWVQFGAPCEKDTLCPKSS